MKKFIFITLLSFFLLNLSGCDLLADNTQYTVLAYTDSTDIGSVSGSGTYDKGTKIEITATANDGYYFDKWSDGDTSNPKIDWILSDLIYIAEFKEGSLIETKGYRITIENGDFELHESSISSLYNYYTITPNNPIKFGCWYNESEFYSADDSLTIYNSDITSDMNLVAYDTLDGYIGFTFKSQEEYDQSRELNYNDLTQLKTSLNNVSIINGYVEIRKNSILVYGYGSDLNILDDGSSDTYSNIKLYDVNLEYTYNRFSIYKIYKRPNLETYYVTNKSNYLISSSSGVGTILKVEENTTTLRQTSVYFSPAA